MKGDRRPTPGLARHETRPADDAPGARSLSHPVDMFIAFAPCQPSVGGRIVVTYAKRRDVEAAGPRVRYLLPGVRRGEP